jgi:6-phospho-beta-glucosidase
MRDIKIGVIGGGSVFTPELVDLLAECPLSIGSLVLMDIDGERLDTIARMARRQVAKKGRTFRVETTADYAEAIDGSDFVLIQLRAGGQKMRIEDEAIALRHAVPFVETVTVPGLGAYLRSVPIYEKLAELIRRRAPHAQVMNFTNPAGAMTQFLQALEVNAVGVCNSPLFFVKAAAETLGVDTADIAMDWKGLNHLTFVSQITAGSSAVNRLPDVLGQVGPWSPGFPFSEHVLGDLGLGINGYLQYYFHARRRLQELQEREASRGQQVLALEKELMSLYAEPGADTVPDLLSKRGGFGYSKVVVNLIQSLVTNDHRVHYVNVRNGSTLTGLPPDTVVEVPAVAVNGEVLALDTGPLPEAVFPLVLTMSTVYRYWVRAALSRSLRDLRLSMLVHPLFPDAEDSEAILSEFFEVNRDFVDPYQ